VGCYFLISTSFTVDPEMMLLVALALRVLGNIRVVGDNPLNNSDENHREDFYYD